MERCTKYAGECLHRHPPPHFLLLLVIPALFPLACIPKDPEDTLNRVLSSQLRVGIVHNPPWTTIEEGPGGIEPELVRDFAEGLGIPVVWEVGGQQQLLDRLSKTELDLVIGGFQSNDPWKKNISFTRPYITVFPQGKKEQHVWAVRHGENEWLLRIEHYLADSRSEAQTLWEDHQP